MENPICIELNGYTAVINVSQLESTIINVSWLRYEEAENVFHLDNKLNTCLKGHWKLLDAKKVFCYADGRNKIFLLLLQCKTSAKHTLVCKTSDNSCVCEITDTIQTLKFDWKINPCIDEGFIKAWIVNGPSLLVCDLKKQVYHFTSFATCNLKGCHQTNYTSLISHSDHVENYDWSSATLHMQCFQNGKTVYYVIVFFALPNDDHKQKCAMQHVIVCHKSCKNCHKKVVTNMDIKLSQKNLYPAHYDGCVSSIHSLKACKNKADSIILLTKMGQVVFCVKGDIRKICDIEHLFECYQILWWRSEGCTFLILHEKLQRYVCIIDFETFRIINFIYGISYVLVGDFLNFGQSQLLLFEKELQISEKFTEHRFFRRRSDITCHKNGRLVPNDEVKCSVTRSDESENSDADFFSAPMEIDANAKHASDSVSKAKVRDILKLSIMQQRDLSEQLKGTIFYKKATIVSTLQLILKLSNNVSNINECSQHPLVPLVPIQQDEDTKLVPKNLPEQIGVTDVFQIVIRNKIYVCARVTNISAQTIYNTTVHVVCDSDSKCLWESNKVQFAMLSKDILPDVKCSKVFPNRSHLKHPVTQFLQDPHCENEKWIKCYFKMSPNLQDTTKPITNKAVSMKLSFQLVELNGGDTTVTLDIKLISTKLEDEDNIVHCLHSSMDDPTFRQYVTFLNLLQSHCYLYSMSSKCHSLAVIRQIFLTDLHFINMHDENIYVCTKRGPLFLLRVYLDLLSAITGRMYVACENAKQHKHFICLLLKFAPADFLIDKET